LRDLDVERLRNRWHTAFGRRPPPHLSRHLLFRTLAYRLQTDRCGDLDGESRRLLDRSGSPEQAGKSAVELSRRTAAIRPGTLLNREWNGHPPIANCTMVISVGVTDPSFLCEPLLLGGP
jgi:hypothetical protein